MELQQITFHVENNGSRSARGGKLASRRAANEKYVTILFTCWSRFCPFDCPRSLRARDEDTELYSVVFPYRARVNTTTHSQKSLHKAKHF